MRRLGGKTAGSLPHIPDGVRTLSTAHRNQRINPPKTIPENPKGRLAVMGLNARGQLGLGERGDSQAVPAIPDGIGGSKNWVSVTSADQATFAIGADGSLWSTGEGPIANYNLGSKRTFTKFSKYSDWVSVAVTNYAPHTAVGIRRVGNTGNGNLWAWGNGGNGRGGWGNSTTYNSPKLIGGNGDWKSLAAGHDFFVGLKTNGSIWTWGRNNFGQIGNGYYNSDSGYPNYTYYNQNRSSPAQINGSTVGFTQIAAGKYHAVALRNGDSWGWGCNALRQLGNGGSTTKNTTIQRITSSGDFVTVAAGNYGSMALKNDGSLWCAGRANTGVLGPPAPSGNYHSVWGPANLGNDWKAIDMNSRTSLLLKKNNTAWMLGWIMTPSGVTITVSSPVQIPGVWSSISIAYDQIRLIEP